jgi:alpha-L-fucosidase
VQPALTPPKVVTGEFKWDGATGVVTFEGELADMAGAAALEVGLEYRSLKGQDANERTLPWIATPFARRASRGPFSATVKGLEAGEVYEYRGVVKHPLLSLYGEDKKAVLK